MGFDWGCRYGVDGEKRWRCWKFGGGGVDEAVFMLLRRVRAKGIGCGVFLLFEI